VDDPTENGRGDWLKKNRSVSVLVMQNCKQRAKETRAKTETAATTEITAAMRATTMRAARMAGKESDVPSW
jgi:tRNA G26 N,N-dimethylase Trm1